MGSRSTRRTPQPRYGSHRPLWGTLVSAGVCYWVVQCLNSETHCFKWEGSLCETSSPASGDAGRGLGQVPRPRVSASLAQAQALLGQTQAEAMARALVIHGPDNLTIQSHRLSESSWPFPGTSPYLHPLVGLCSRPGSGGR